MATDFDFRLGFNGKTYDVSHSGDIATFEAKLNGSPVTDPALLGNLWSYASAAQSIVFFDSKIRFDDNIDALNNQLDAIKKVEWWSDARDTLGGFIGKVGVTIATGGTSVKKFLFDTAKDIAIDQLKSLTFTELTLHTAARVIDELKDQVPVIQTSLSGYSQLIESGGYLDASDIKAVLDSFVRINVVMTNAGLALSSFQNAYQSGSILSDLAKMGINAFEGATLGYIDIKSDVGKKITDFYELASSGYKLVDESLDPLLIDSILSVFEGVDEGYLLLSDFEIQKNIDAFRANLEEPVLKNPTVIQDLNSVTNGESANDTSDARLYIHSAVKPENSDGIDFIVTLSEKLPYDVTFSYSMYDLSGQDNATAGEDFLELINQTKTIKAGTTVSTIPVTVYNDTKIESPVENIYLSVYEVNGATLPNGAWNDVFEGYIIDDDYTQQSTATRPISDFLEVDENSATTPSTLEPNLSVSHFKSSHSKASYKEELELTFTVQNLGRQTSEGGRVQVILADEDEALEDGKVINDYNIPTLTSGDKHTYNKSIDLPTTGKGDYKIGVLVVPDVEEIITTDNAKYSALEIGPGLSGQPDLRSYITTNIRESVFYVGEEVTVDYRVKAGPDGSTSFNYGLYLSSDEYWSSDDILLHESYSRGLGSGGTNYASATFEMPALSNGKDGVAYLISVADINDSVNEESETNNTRVSDFALSNDGPDVNTLTNLTAGSLFISDSLLYAGESFTYRPNVAISSPDDALPVLDHYSIFSAGAYKTSLIISEDRVLDSGDKVIQTSIKSGLNRVDSTGVTISLPEWVEAGNYYFAVAVDLINEIDEDNELDNLTPWQKIDVVNNVRQTVYAVDDLLAIKPGEKTIVDLLSNDYSDNNESLVLKYIGSEQFNSSFFNGLPLENGLKINKLDDGSLEVDATAVEESAVFATSVPYQISGGQSYYDDLAYLNIFVGVSVPESVVNDTPKDTENDLTNSSDANTALSVTSIQSGGGFDPTIPGYVGAVVVEGDPDNPLIFAVNLNDATPEEGAKLVLEFTDDSAAFGQDTSSNISLDFGDGSGFVATTVSPQQSNGITTFTIDLPAQVEKLSVALPTINDGLLEAAESLSFSAYIEGTEKLFGVTGTIIDSNRANLNYVESVAVGVGAFDPNLLGGSIGTSVTEGAEANPLLFQVNLHEFTSSDGQYVTLSFVDDTAQFGVDTANSVSLDLGDGNGFVNSTAAFTTANGVSSAQVYVAEGIGSFMVALQVIDDAIQEDAEQISFTAKTTNNDTFNEAVNSVTAYILDNGDTEVSTDTPQENQANTNPPIFLAIENGIQVNVTPEVYTGTVDFLEYQFLGNLNGNVVNGAETNDFINLLAGDDAADGKGGRDVLDGGIGSNFLTGGTGDDTFFIDGRSGVTTWSTITDFTSGDTVNIWGWLEGTSQLLATDESAGAEGFKGVTFHYDLNNNEQIDTSITFSGLTSAQAPTSSAQIVADNGYLLFA